MATVTFEHVSKLYGQVKAVDDLSLEIRDGEFMVLVGPSGCGKTTSLRMIAGLEDISLGTLRIGDRVVNDVAAQGPRHRHGLPELRALPAHDRRGQPRLRPEAAPHARRQEIERRVKDAADILDLGRYLDRKPKALSGGQRQRVALGRAIVREPAVFLMDEPLSNLDAKLRVQTRAEIARLHQRLKTTIVYVTHDQVEAMTMGNRIAVMSEGRLQQVGHAAGALRLPDQPLRRRVHRQPVDELHRRGPHPRAAERRRGSRPPASRSPSPTGIATPSAAWRAGRSSQGSGRSISSSGPIGRGRSGVASAASPRSWSTSATSSCST